MSAENGISRRAALVKLGLFLNGIVGVFLAVPIVRYLLSPVIREKKFGYDVVAFARRAGTVSRRPDSARHLSQSRGQCLGRRNRRHRVLGSECRRSDIPGLCHKLRAPWMPGSLVCAVEPLHVSLPRRRLLPGWIAGFWTSRARIVPVQLQNRRRKTSHQSWRNADSWSAGRK